MPADLDFAAIFELAPNPYMVVDRELRYVAVNAAYLEATGARREDLIGRPLFELFPNDPADPGNAPARMLRASFERVLATGKPDHLALIPYRVPRVVAGTTIDEERFWSATHTPLRDPSGRVVHILQHTVDVTDLRPRSDPSSSRRGDEMRTSVGVLDRARAVQEENVVLASEREHLRELFEQAPGFMCVLEGPDHVFTLANDAYHRLVGDRQLVGKPVREALPEVVDQGFITVLDRVLATGEPFIGDGMRVMIQRSPSTPPEEVFVDFVYQPVRDDDGTSRGIFVQGHDVTLRLRAELESTEARRAAEAFSAELLEQSRDTRRALEAAGSRIRDLEAQLESR